MDGAPTISGPFTGWYAQKMHTLLDYLRTHDQHAPDFVRLAAEEGLVRKECLEGEPRTPEEDIAVA